MGSAGVALPCGGEQRVLTASSPASTTPLTWNADMLENWVRSISWVEKEWQNPRRGRAYTPQHRRRLFWFLKSYKQGNSSTMISTTNANFTFRVLCGFRILDDFLMSTSVVFTQPGWKWKQRHKGIFRCEGSDQLMHSLMTHPPEPEQTPPKASHSQAMPCTRTTKSLY